MKRRVLICCALFLSALSFLLGWRVMPRIWPAVKKAVVYPVFPQMKPAPTPTMPPYVPESDTSYGDPIRISDSLIYYFYKDYCSYCREISPLMAGLPREVRLPDGTVSRVRLVALNKAESEYHRIINDYYENHGIQTDRRYVPAVVVGSRYLHLRDEITDQLMDALVSGEGLETPLLDGSERMR